MIEPTDDESALSRPASTGAGNGVNQQAPVVGACEIEIAAAPEDVWAVLTEFERWPSWNPDVKSVAMDGGVAVRSEFRWKAGPGTITSTIRRVEPPFLVAWPGKTLGIREIHFWWLEARDGSTFVRTEESYDGAVAWLFRRPLQKTLDRALANGLRHLKAEVEGGRLRGRASRRERSAVHRHVTRYVPSSERESLAGCSTPA